MNLTRPQVIGLATTCLIIFNVSLVTDSELGGVQIALDLTLLIFAPGFLISGLIRQTHESVWHRLVYSVGLSLLFLLVLGLTANTVLPHIGVSRPMARTPLLFSYDVGMVILLWIFMRRRKDPSFRISVPNFSLTSVAHLTVTVVLLGLSVCGAVYLNNGGSPYITMAML